MIGRCIVFLIAAKFNQGLTIFIANYALLTCGLIYVLALNSYVSKSGVRLFPYCLLAYIMPPLYKP